jgi:acyl-CoA thioesterase
VNLQEQSLAMAATYFSDMMVALKAKYQAVQTTNPEKYQIMTLFHSSWSVRNPASSLKEHIRYAKVP